MANKLQKGALDSQPQVIKFTYCFPMVGGSLWVTPTSSTTKTGRHNIAEILLKVALNTKSQSIKKRWAASTEIYNDTCIKQSVIYKC